MSGSLKSKLGSFVVVWCMVFSLFAGLMLVSMPNVGEAALPSVLPNGDLIIGSDYAISSWPASPDLHGATQYMDGNLTIRAGGVVTINNGGLSFTQDLGPDRLPNTGDEHIYTLIIEDGGRLILNNAFVTTHLDQICDYPNLGVLVQNGGSIQATNTVFSFPGQMVVDDSSLVFNNVQFTGQDDSNISKYCNPNYFPTSAFDHSAVLYISSSQVQMFNSKVERIFEGVGASLYPSIVSHNYGFASDTGARDLVRYSLNRHVTGFGAANTATGLIGNLAMADQLYVTVAPAQILAIDSTAMDGLVFPASASYTVTLNVLYKTDFGYVNPTSAPVNWGFENTPLAATTIVPYDTYQAYDPTTTQDRQSSFALPQMSASDLSNLNVSFTNPATSNIYFNKIWFTVSFQVPSYRNVTVAGSSDFTAVDTMIGVDFQNTTSNAHNQLNVVDNAKAYLYGAYTDDNTVTNFWDRYPAYSVSSSKMEVFATAKGPADTTGASLGNLRTVNGVFYDITNGVMAVQNFNAGGITGQITGLVMNVTSTTVGGYSDAGSSVYVQYGLDYSSMKSSSIRPSGVGLTNAKFDLYAAGITNLTQLAALKIRFTSAQVAPATVRFDKISIEVTTAPSMYIYRWMDFNAFDQQSLPISGMYVNASLQMSGASAYYISSAGVQNVPPAAILAYIGKTSSNYMLTNNSGGVRLPLLSEALTDRSQMPNTKIIGGYALAMTYRNVSGALFNGASAVSFSPYPAIDKASENKGVNFTMPGLFLDKPDLVISSFTVSPTTLYLDDAAVLSANVTNIGLTGAINVEINFTDSQTAWTFNTTIPFLGPGASQIVQTSWVANPSGLHTLTVKVDSRNLIIESNHANNDRSIQVNVLANLPELAITSAGISFSPQPASTSQPVVGTVLVSNTAGRADAKNVTVSFYIGDPRSGGMFIGMTVMNVTKGTTNTTTFSWVQSQIGTYQVFVWVNKERNPQEYSYAENLASKEIIVNLSFTGTDLVVNGHNTTIFSGTQFTYRGRIIVMDFGTLTISNASLVIDQDTDYQFQIYVQDNGRLVLSSASLTSGQNLWIYLNDNATVQIDNSVVSTSVRMSLGDYTSLSVTGSTIGSDIITQANSHSVLTAKNSTFLTLWSNFGASAKAYLTSVAFNGAPSLQPKEAAVIYLYRWVDVTVLDGNNKPLPNAHIQMDYYLSGMVYGSANSNAQGKGLFAGLCNVVDSSGFTYVGNFKLNSTYKGVAYQTNGTTPVSLAPYSQSSPLVKADVAIQLKIPGALPDLDSSFHVSNSTPYRGDNVTLTAQINNIGVVEAQNVLVRFMDNSNLIKEVVVPSIAHNATVQVIWQANYPLGQHNISVMVDPNNVLNEMSKGNNLNWSIVTVVGIAELSVTNSDVFITTNLPSANPTTNTTASISITVHNSGDVPANDVNVSFIDVRPNGAHVLIGYGNIVSIPAYGGTGVATVAWTPNMPGMHTLLIDVNVGIPPISETTASNNNVSYPVQVMNYADLVPTLISYTPSTLIYVGNEVSIDATISNIGQTTASNVVVRFWQGPAVTGQLLGTKIISTIDPDQSLVISSSWNVQPIGVEKIQARNITVDVNPSHVIREITYTNNIRIQQVIVIDARPDLQFVGPMNVTSGNVKVSGAVVGETVVVHTVIKNDGFRPALGTQIRLSAIDSDYFATQLVTVTRDFQANQTLQVDINWIVNLTIGRYSLRVDIDPNHLINETIESNNFIATPFQVNPPSPKITVNVAGTQYQPDSDLQAFGQVLNSKTNEPLVGMPVVIMVVDSGLNQIGDNSTVYTSSTGDYIGTLTLLANIQNGYYTVHAQVKTGNSTVTQVSSPFQVEAQTVEASLPFWVWMLVIIVVAAIIIAFSVYLYRYGLGRMVECGECGALVSEASKRCPKCGVEFEKGTAKCSQCGAWIPANSTECPECGAKFLNEPLAEEESEYMKKMREQYELYVDQ